MQTFVYRISADSAEKYLNKKIENLDQYLSQQPTAIFYKDSVNYFANSLPIGNYLFISVEDNNLVAEYFCSTKIQSFIVNNEHRPQLFIRDENGVAYANASVWMNKIPATFLAKAGTYQIRQKNAEDDIVKIAVPGDTCFVSLDVLQENYRTIAEQRLAFFRGSKIGRMINWLPARVKFMQKHKPCYWFNFRRTNKANRNTGFIIFNKQKYFPSDTIKFKAYVLSPKGKQYKKSLDVFINYNYNGKFISKKLTTLKPLTSGAFVYKFATGDTLPNDTRYTIRLLTKKEMQLQNGSFSIEDYLLKEVSTYNLKSQKDEYFLGDTMVFNVSAKDANGLPLMDGKQIPLPFV